MLMRIISVLDKLPKIETRKHALISLCAEIIACMPNALEITPRGVKRLLSRFDQVVEGLHAIGSASV